MYSPNKPFADPFLDANQGDDKGVQDGLIHIRIQQRSGRKTLTTVQGIADSYDKKKIVKACKKVRHVVITCCLKLNCIESSRNLPVTGQSSNTLSMER